MDWVALSSASLRLVRDKTLKMLVRLINQLVIVSELNSEIRNRIKLGKKLDIVLIVTR